MQLLIGIIRGVGGDMGGLATDDGDHKVAAMTLRMATEITEAMRRKRARKLCRMVDTKKTMTANKMMS